MTKFQGAIVNAIKKSKWNKLQIIPSFRIDGERESIILGGRFLDRGGGAGLRVGRGVLRSARGVRECIEERRTFSVVVTLIGDFAWVFRGASEDGTSKSLNRKWKSRP